MAKTKNPANVTPDNNIVASEDVSPDTREDQPEALEALPEDPDTAIVVAPTQQLSTLADKLAENNTPLFLATYGDQVASVMSDTPSKSRINQIIDALPDEYADALASLIRRNMGKRKGMYTDNDRPELPELRIFHGTGNDPNRPENIIPGHYYLTSRENVGKEFIGTLLTVYKGRTMWGDRDAGENTRMPVCHSMDRKVGTSFGLCDVCPNRPWKDGKMQRCSDDVIAYMLTKDLKEIVLVRFAKTSEAAGRQLIKFARRTEDNWSKWYSITAEAVVNQNDKTQRYFVMKAAPVEGDGAYVDESLTDFCDMMCTVLEGNVILPGMANVYRQAKNLLDGPAPTTAPVETASAASAVAGTPNYEVLAGVDDLPNV